MNKLLKFVNLPIHFLKKTTSYDKFLEYTYQHHEFSVWYESSSKLLFDIKILPYNIPGILESYTNVENNKNISTNALIIMVIEYLTPNYVYFNCWPDLSIVQNIKMKFPQLKLITWDGIGRHDENYFRHFDLVLTCLSKSESFYLEKNIKSKKITFGFNTEITKKLVKKEKINKVVFAGSINFSDGMHYNRLNVIYYLKKRLREKFDIYIKFGKTKYLFPFFILQVVRRKWKLSNFKYIFMVKYLKKLNNPHVQGYSYFQLLYNYNIVLNNHLDNASNEMANIRCFEATGLGCVLLTDYKFNNGDYFDVGNEIFEYRNIDEAEKLCLMLLDNTTLCDKVSNNAKLKTKRLYNLEQFCNNILLNIKKL